MSDNIYSIDKYAEKIAKVSRNTVLSRIKNGQLPSTHMVIKGKQYFIQVNDVSERCRECEKYYMAACYFHDKKPKRSAHESKRDEDRALAAETVIKFDLHATKFFKMMGL